MADSAPNSPDRGQRDEPAPSPRADTLIRAFLAALGELTERERLTGVFFKSRHARDDQD